MTSPPPHPIGLTPETRVSYWDKQLVPHLPEAVQPNAIGYVEDILSRFRGHERDIAELFAYNAQTRTGDFYHSGTVLTGLAHKLTQDGPSPHKRGTHVQAKLFDLYALLAKNMGNN